MAPIAIQVNLCGFLCKLRVRKILRLDQFQQRIPKHKLIVPIVKPIQLVQIGIQMLYALLHTAYVLWFFVHPSNVSRCVGLDGQKGWTGARISPKFPECRALVVNATSF